MRTPISEYLDDLHSALPYPEPVREQVLGEARDHLLSVADQLFSNQVGRDAAERAAIERFGSVEEFVARFEASGGPVALADPLPLTRGVPLYVGVLLGLAVASALQNPLFALLGLLLGTAATRLSLAARNLGPLLGCSFGLLVANLAVVPYLSQTDVGSTLGVAAIVAVACASAGGLAGFIPRLRRDPTPLVWITGAGLFALIGARLWIQDRPTLTGIGVLAAGSILGYLVSLRKGARRYSAVPFGALGGVLAAGLILSLMPLLEEAVGGSVLFTVIQPGAVLAGSTVIGLVAGATAAAAQERVT